MSVFDWISIWCNWSVRMLCVYGFYRDFYNLQCDSNVSWFAKWVIHNVSHVCVCVSVFYLIYRIKSIVARGRRQIGTNRNQLKLDSIFHCKSNWCLHKIFPSCRTAKHAILHVVHNTHGKPSHSYIAQMWESCNCLTKFIFSRSSICFLPFCLFRYLLTYNFSINVCGKYYMISLLKWRAFNYSLLLFSPPFRGFSCFSFVSLCLYFIHVYKIYFTSHAILND